MKLVSALVVVAWMAAQSVQAQAPEPSPEVKAAREAVAKACKGQGQKLCPGKRGQEMAACMKSNEDKLTPDCKEAISKLPAMHH
jgi:hypothetical protein